MKRSNFIATACVTAALSALTLLNASAQDSGAAAIEKSILTFSAPIELPGMTLPAGTYVFKRPDANSARVIQVFSEDEKKIHGTFLTVPTTRQEVTGENVVTFRETAQGTTPAVRFWYYPARGTGHEFVYPKDQAMRIAARTHEPVLSTEGDITAADAKVTTVGDDAAASEQASAAPAPARADSSADRTAAAPVNEQARASAPVRMPQTERPVGTAGQAEPKPAAELPATASPLAFSQLLGLLSLAGAAALRRFL